MLRAVSQISWSRTAPSFWQKLEQRTPSTIRHDRKGFTPCQTRLRHLPYSVLQPPRPLPLTPSDAIRSYLNARASPEFQLCLHDIQPIVQAVIANRERAILSMLQDDADKLSLLQSYSTSAQAWGSILHSVSLHSPKELLSSKIKASEVILMWSKVVTYASAAEDYDPSSPNDLSSASEERLSPQAALLVLQSINTIGLEEVQRRVQVNINRLLWAVRALTRPIIEDLSALDFHIKSVQLLHLILHLAQWSYPPSSFPKEILSATFEIYNSIISKSIVSTTSSIAGSNLSLGVQEVTSITPDERFAFFRLIILRTIARELADRQEWHLCFTAFKGLAVQNLTCGPLMDDSTLVRQTVREALEYANLDLFSLTAVFRWMRSQLLIWWPASNPEARKLILCFVEACIQLDHLRFFDYILEHFHWWYRSEPDALFNLSDSNLVYLLRFICVDSSQTTGRKKRKLDWLCGFLYSRVSRSPPDSMDDDLANSVLTSLSASQFSQRVGETWLIRFYRLFQRKTCCFLLSQNMKVEPSTLVRMVRRMSGDRAFARSIVNDFIRQRKTGADSFQHYGFEHKDLTALTRCFYVLQDLWSARQLLTERRERGLYPSKLDIKIEAQVRILQLGPARGCKTLQTAYNLGIQPDHSTIDGMAEAIVTYCEARPSAITFGNISKLMKMSKALGIYKFQKTVRRCVFHMLKQTRLVDGPRERSLRRISIIAALSHNHVVDLRVALGFIGEAAKDGDPFEVMKLYELTSKSGCVHEKMLTYTVHNLLALRSKNDRFSRMKFIRRIVKWSRRRMRLSGFSSKAFAVLCSVARIQDDLESLIAIAEWMENEGVTTTSSIATDTSAWLDKKGIARESVQRLWWIL